MSLGTYPHLTLARARALRDEYLSLLANGINPQVHNTQKANALKDATEHTFQAVAKKWLDEKSKRQASPGNPPFLTGQISRIR
jgi:hypothetical protein